MSTPKGIYFAVVNGQEYLFVGEPTPEILAAGEVWTARPRWTDVSITRPMKGQESLDLQFSTNQE